MRPAGILFATSFELVGSEQTRICVCTAAFKAERTS
jgi:hypothetical protein